MSDLLAALLFVVLVAVIWLACDWAVAQQLSSIQQQYSVVTPR